MTPENGLDPNAPITLKEAAEVYLRGIVKDSTLKAAAARGDLVIERIGNKLVTTPADIVKWRNLCRDRERARISGSAARNEGRTEQSAQTPDGLFGMDQLSLARDAALATATALKNGLPNTSSKNTNHPAANVHFPKSGSQT